MVAGHPGDSCLVHIYCCCTWEVPALALEDIDPSTRQLSMAPGLLGLGQRFAPGPELPELVQPVLVACSMPRLAVAVECLGLVID